MDWMIYGANGYTGELIAREAKKRGANPVLAGRDPTKIAKLVTDLSLPSKVFSLDKPPDIVFGGVSMKTHSTPFRLAFFTIWAMSRFTIFRGRADSARSSFQSVSEPCGSSSISRHGRIDLCTWTARCAAKVLLPAPPLRDAKASTFIDAIQRTG